MFTLFLGGAQEIMSDKHKSRLKRSSIDIIHNLNPDVPFLNELIQNGLLSEYEHQRIMSKETDMDKSRQILHIMLIKSDECFFKFAQSLCDTKQCHLAEKLRPCGENYIINRFIMYHLLSVVLVQ